METSKLEKNVIELLLNDFKDSTQKKKQKKIHFLLDIKIYYHIILY